MEKEIKKGKIIIYKNKNGSKIDVRLEQETAWLNLTQIALLFNTDKSGISRHINNIFKDKELVKKSTIAKIATVQKEGKRKIKRDIDYYNLDLILSVGYRVNSKRATQFRIWATKTLKDYLIKGFAVNESRLLESEHKFRELQIAINFLKDKAGHELLAGQELEILNLLADYSKTLTLLEQYDKEKVSVVRNGKGIFIFNYIVVEKIITEIKKELFKRGEASELFGVDN